MKRSTLLFVFVIGTVGISAQKNSPTNKHFWESSVTQAKPQEVWTVWTDVPNWKTWDTGLKEASIEGEFKLGAKGKIVSLEGRTSKFKVVSWVEGESYTIKTKLPLGSLFVKRFPLVKDGATHFTHEVWFKGLSAGLFARNFGPKFRGLLPEVLLNVKTKVETDVIP